MKHLVTLIAIVTALALSQSCRRHASTVAPYGWPTVTPAFDSLTVEAEKLYFIAANPDSLKSVIERMQQVASGLKGRKGADARSCIDYWKVCYSMIMGNPADVRLKLDSFLTRNSNPSFNQEYVNQRLKLFDKPYFQSTSIETFKELLMSLDYFRKIGDLPEAGNVAVRISNSLQMTYAPNLALDYLMLADSLYAFSGQESRRMNVKLNEPMILCRSGSMDEGRDRMDALLSDSNALRDPLGREIMFRNHYCFFNDSASLFEGYRITNEFIGNSDMGKIYLEQKALYEVLLCEFYMKANLPDSAAMHFRRIEYDKLENLEFQCKAYEIKFKYLESIGKDHEALNAILKYLALTDSINKHTDPEKKEYLERVNALNQHKAEAAREKRAIERKHGFIASFLIFLLLVAVIVVQWLRHRHKVRTINLKMEAEKMERQILAMSLTKEETEKVLDKVKEETTRLKNEGTVSARDLSEIETNIKIHMAAKDEMQAFEKAFAEVSPEFAEKLKAISPTISAHNIRICTYLYMGLSNQQLCTILNVTPGALRQAKRRLRQRFGLAGDDSIEDFLRTL